MKRRTRDWKKIEWMDSFLTSLRDEIKTQARNIPARDLEEISCVLTDVMCQIMGEGWAVGAFGGRKAAFSMLSEELGLPRKTIRRYLQFAARCGLLKGVLKRDANSPEFNALEIVMCPGFQEAFEQQWNKVRMGRVVKVFAETFVARRDYDGAVQGFGRVCPWGVMSETVHELKRYIQVEGQPDTRAPDEAAPPVRDLVKEIMAAADGTREDPKARKKKEDQAWLTARDTFVAGCATVWARYQSKRGMGTEAPAWAGDRRHLPHAQGQERKELEKIFGLYGGRLAALSWTAFCGGLPEYDAKGRLKFNPAKAHRQWTTPDKKPSHYAKHINLVIDDLRSSDWEQDNELVERLRGVFKDAFDMEARNAVIVNRYQPEVTSVDPQATSSATR